MLGSVSNIVEGAEIALSGPIERCSSLSATLIPKSAFERAIRFSFCEFKSLSFAETIDDKVKTKSTIKAIAPMANTSANAPLFLVGGVIFFIVRSNSGGRKKAILRKAGAQNQSRASYECPNSKIHPVFVVFYKNFDALQALFVQS